MEFHAVPSVPPEVCERNAALALALGLPEVERAGHVAVVGGGPSLVDHLDELRSWNGPIWAVNQVFMWLKSKGIKATFITADPKPQPWLKVERDDQALVALHGYPELFASLACHVRTYRLANDAVHCGPTTATAAAHLALYMGHRSVTYFGCDSSFADQTHVYDLPPPGDMIGVRCDGVDYLTKPEFLMQADNLAAFCREFGFCTNRSGGLLAALIACPDREVLGYTEPEKAVA